MPRTSAGARLHRRKETGIFIIRDDSRYISTGKRDRRQADQALARYIAERNRPTGGPRTPDQMTVADALSIYGKDHAPTARAPETIGYSIKALLPILGTLPVGSVTGEVCRRYAKARDRSPGTTRRELGVLQAAVNYAHAEGYLTAPIKVKLPPMPAPKDRWLTRDEVAALLRAARRNPKARHLCRFIILAVYTGTRSDAILRMGFMPSTIGGWIDTERGVIHRRAAGEIESKKRTPTVPVPGRLLAHLRRWERMGARWVVEIDGQRVGSVRTAWRKALRDSGIDPCRPHDLRHTCATWLMQAGADKWAVVGYLGMGLDMLERVYGHHHPDHLCSAIKAMEQRG